MTFDWTDYHRLAYQWLDEIELKEAYFRSAISRAYYFAFHDAVRYLVAAERFDPDRWTGLHTVVINRFENSSDLNQRKIGAKLKRLRSHRVDADYYDHVPMGSHEQAVKLVELSDEIVRKIGGLGK
jgi:uncharacterized protein (UPF0332 family)